jgi:hypothetical protein
LELTEHLSDWASRRDSKNRRATLERDVDCLLRTYLPGKSSKKGHIEESFDCPLVELGLIQPLEDGERFGFVIGNKRSLPTAVFTYALLDYLERNRRDRQTVTLQDVLYEPGSPGQAFKLSENALIECLESVEELTEGAVQVDDTAGLKQIYLHKSIDRLGLLAGFFEGLV